MHFLHKAHHSLLALRNTTQHFITTLGAILENEITYKRKNAKDVALNRLRKRHACVHVHIHYIYYLLLLKAIEYILIFSFFAFVVPFSDKKPSPHYPYYLLIRSTPCKKSTFCFCLLLHAPSEAYPSPYSALMSCVRSAL